MPTPPKPPTKKSKTPKTGKLITDVRAVKKATPTIPTAPLLYVLQSQRQKYIYRLFAVGALLILIASTIFWSVLGARLHAQNADQLVDSYMFSNWQTFQGAHFPATHTFLLKWPLFALGAAFGNTPFALSMLTVACGLGAVLFMAWLLRKIVPRDETWALLILGMALVLLLTPTQPYAGALLPVSFAMLTTRNLEYVVYIAAILFTIKSPRFYGKYMVAAALLFALLFASDRLFVPLSLGGAVLVWCAGLFFKKTGLELRKVGLKWLAVSVIGFIGSLAILYVLKNTGVTHLENGTTVSPYQLNTPHGLMVAGVYAVLGLLSVLGLNPVPGNVLLREWPQAFLTQLREIPGIAYTVVFAGVLLAGLLAVRNVKARPKSGFSLPRWAILLFAATVSTTLVAILSFVATKHYYAVDARYLSMAFFALFIGLACGIRNWLPSVRASYLSGLILLVGITAAAHGNYFTYSSSRAALAPFSERNSRIAQILRQHRVKAVVGDYWRVLPIRAEMDGKQKVVPLGDCTTPRQTLTSDAWRLNPRDSFAYLLSYDKGLTDYPLCQFEEVLRAYGRPSSSVAVAGNIKDPREVLLFYDRGLRPNNLHDSGVSASSLAPELLSSLVLADCNQGTTLTVVAHPDDDILFTSPDLLHQIREGRCMRTVYLTAGDAGSNSYYWLGRQAGSQAAYANMVGHRQSWQSHTFQLSTGQYITVSTPHNNPKISLIFLNLPDGNTRGEGFGGSKQQSLQKVYNGINARISTVDAQSSYSSEDITKALEELLGVFQPNELHAQAEVAHTLYPDHSDHEVAGLFAQRALDRYQTAAELSVHMVKYVGYPIHSLPQNVGGDDLARKQAAFMAYAAHDGGVCQHIDACYAHSVYGIYLGRQYTEEMFATVQAPQPSE
ncbi:MAG: PIG-L family deacetylase [Candidatus Saccharimonadales bacterium]